MLGFIIKLFVSTFIKEFVVLFWCIKPSNGYRVAKKKENSKTNTNASKSLYFIIKWWRSVQDAFSQSKYCKPFATACIVSFRVFGRQGLMTMQTILDLFPTVSFLLERRFYLSRGEFSRAKGLNWMIN